MMCCDAGNACDSTACILILQLSGVSCVPIADCMVNRQPQGQEVGRGMMGVEFSALRIAQGARGAPSPQTTINLGVSVPRPHTHVCILMRSCWC